ncbi:hypothetical protein FHX42_003533 [Saccharopolyspora lacisalsi]|uniref:Integral membrane protein n=1 Tax=Halosaccharopolyspora lacisalsi TaxID=1000566 RepID=A0A839E334_9PSEU|nr:hypothetical protein [Halosaccharopolyspora lacisalsi]MBA8826157.1 hypothetical protein [Halosaccharopolyspora lacisalsi]
MTLRTTSRLRWIASIVANLLLGCIAVIPLWLLWLFALDFPFAALGLTRRAPTENDGVLPWLIVLVPLLTVLVALWILINFWMRRKSEMPTRTYWVASSVVMLFPVIFSSIVAGIP